MTRPELYFYTWDQLLDNELRRAIGELRSFTTSTAETIGLLEERGWDPIEVERLLRLDLLPALPGDLVLALTKEDLLDKSYTQVRVTVKSAIATSLTSFRSTRAAADFLGVNDKYLTGLMVR